MQKFLTAVGPHIPAFKAVKLHRVELEHVHAMVAKHLGVKQIHQVRDRLEGSAFLSKFSKNVLGTVAVERFLNLERLQLHNGSFPKNFKPTIDVHGQALTINIFEFGSFPVIEKINHGPILFVVRKEVLNFLICGVAGAMTLNEYQDRKLIENLHPDTKTGFFGFDQLLHFSDLDSLAELL